MGQLEGEQTFIDLLKIKRDKLNEMLEDTQSSVLGDTAQSSIIFIDLMGRREEIVEALKEINEQLAHPSFDPIKAELKKMEGNTEVFSIISETDSIIQNIIALDKANEPKVQSSMAQIKQGIKSIKTGKAVTNIYQQGDNMLEEMQFEFDRKK